MVKKIKMTKRQYRKLSKSWLGIIAILSILGFNFYQEYKPVSGSERFEVTLDQCVDGDTAWFDIDGKRTKVRFLYIDTPESTNQIELGTNIENDTMIGPILFIIKCFNKIRGLLAPKTNAANENSCSFKVIT